jgi:hypothetical protein
MKDLIFRLLFPKQRAMMFEAARRFAYVELGRDYRRKLMSLQRSPLDESVWVRKFVALDSDYAALVCDMVILRDRNTYLEQRVKELLEAK